MIKPSWLTTYPNSSVMYGFDTKGMWFRGDANEGVTYPVRTNFDISQNTVTTVIFTFINSSEDDGDNCSDQGICIFSTSETAEWEWGSNLTRIAYQMNCDYPELSGQTTSVSGNEGTIVLGNTYTGKFVYDPDAGTVTAELYEGDKASGLLLSTLTINENLPAGNYRVGFDADLDASNVKLKSYFTYINVNGLELFNTTSTCPVDTCTVPGFPCLKPSAGCTCAEMTLFKGAFVPAIAVCNNRLF